MKKLSAVMKELIFLLQNAPKKLIFRTVNIVKIGLLDN